MTDSDKDKQQYILDEIMIIGISEANYTVFSYTAKDGQKAVSGLNIETRKSFRLSTEQVEIYYILRNCHRKRMNNAIGDNIFDYKADYDKQNHGIMVEKTVLHGEANSVKTRLVINNRDYEITWYSFLYNKKGDSLVVSVSESEIEDYLSTQSLYNDIDLKISLTEFDLMYQGSVVRIERVDTEYLLYIQPYPMEVMQSTICSNTSFNNVRNPYTVMDFIVNHADGDIKGVNYPNSDDKPIHNYVVIGLLKNVDIKVEDCAIGNVRIGGHIDASNKFKETISEYLDDCATIAWVNVETDSLYNAFLLGKKLLSAAAEFLEFIIKNDMYVDWFGTVDLNNDVWDVRSHNPKITMCPVFYIEDCFSGESITLQDENMKIPRAIKIGESAEYLFDYDWIDNFFDKLQTEDKKMLRLQYAMKWIIQAWNAENPYDKIIYCAMALEFIVNGEKGNSIFDEYASKAGKAFTKSEKSSLINTIVENVKLNDIEGFSENIVKDFNESIGRMIRSKLTDVSFGSKLDNLIDRLNIPVSENEKKLLNDARKIRNELIHGINMTSITTLEMKKLCGITSRILMYKIMHELRK